MFTQNRLAGAVLISAVALSLALTGCSTQEDRHGGKSASTAQSDLTEWQLKLADCLRDQGVDVPDPAKGEAGFAPSSGDKDAIEKAFAMCHTKLGDPPATASGGEQDTKARLEEALKTAKCFRDNGVDVADPDSSGSLKVPSDAPDAVIAKCGGGVAIPAAPEESQ